MVPTSSVCIRMIGNVAEVIARRLSPTSAAAATWAKQREAAAISERPGSIAMTLHFAIGEAPDDAEILRVFSRRRLLS